MQRRTSLVLKFCAGSVALAANSVMMIQPLHAQRAEQTPENAHRFLTNLSTRGEVTIEPPENVVTSEHYTELMNTDRGPYCRKAACMRPTLVMSQSKGPAYPFVLDSSSRCSTRLTGKPTVVEVEITPSGKRGFPDTKVTRAYKLHLDTLYDQGIDWSAVSSVTMREGTASVQVRSKALRGQAMLLNFETPDIAARAAFALDVIRQSCDPLAGSAF